MGQKSSRAKLVSRAKQTRKAMKAAQRVAEGWRVDAGGWDEHGQRGRGEEVAEHIGAAVG